MPRGCALYGTYRKAPKTSLWTNGMQFTIGWGVPLFGPPNLMDHWQLWSLVRFFMRKFSRTESDLLCLVPLLSFKESPLPMPASTDVRDVLRARATLPKWLRELPRGDIPSSSSVMQFIVHTQRPTKLSYWVDIEFPVTLKFRSLNLLLPVKCWRNFPPSKLYERMNWKKTNHWTTEYYTKSFIP